LLAEIGGEHRNLRLAKTTRYRWRLGFLVFLYQGLRAGAPVIQREQLRLDSRRYQGSGAPAFLAPFFWLAGLSKKRPKE
jgi:hypothetical protein